jgi:zeaxanthin glucosyltransferase
MVAFADAGHLNPLVSVAQQLEAAGHEVLFWSANGDLSARLAAADLRARCVGATGATPEAVDGVELGRRMLKLRWAQRFMQETLVDRAGAQVEALREIVRAETPDLVACDAMAYAGAIAAEREGVAWAGLSTGFFALIPPDWSTPVGDLFAALAAPREAMFRAHGVSARFRLSDVISPKLNLVFASEALIDRARSRNDYAIHVGPPRPLGKRGDERPFPWERVPKDRPLVYVAFGSHLSHGREVYDALFAALGPDEAFFVVALKSLARDPWAASLPAHVLAVEYAPQLALLERAAVMVNHGGANSVMESLGRGCPMLVLPLTYDQPAIARIVADSGAGATLEASTITVEAARAQLRALIDPQGPARARARAIGAGFEDGAARAASLLAELTQ